MKRDYLSYLSRTGNISKKKIEITDRTIQKNSLGKALNMKLPSKERILIMNLEH